MAVRHVDVQGVVGVPPSQCWKILRAFCSPWHPAIATMRAEDAGRVRAFTVTGEETLYRERLTWFSHSECSLGYTHLEGIEGATRYDAMVSVSAAEDGKSNVQWQAEIEADDARADEIAAGTTTVFEMGIAALANTTQPDETAPQAVHQSIELVEKQIAGATDLAILTGPNTDGPLCLFLHGIGGQKQNWKPQLGAIGGRVSACAMDLRGYGRSALGPDPSTLDDYFDDILAIRSAFGNRPLVLCGLSYGAWIATAFAHRYPETLAGLVLAGGCTGMSEASAAEQQSFREARERPLSQGQTPADFAPALVDVIAGPDAGSDLRDTLAASMAAIPAATYRDALQCFTNPPGMFDFAPLTMPVLMMTGSYDRLAPPIEIHGVARRILRSSSAPDVRYEEITNAGHVCNLEQPQMFNQILIDFLGRVTA